MRLFVALNLLPTDCTVVLDHFCPLISAPVVMILCQKLENLKKVLNSVLTGPKGDDSLIQDNYPFANAPQNVAYLFKILVLKCQR